jgi:hypothetical protein
MKTYVSVDLDYWGMTERCIGSAIRFLNRIQRLNLPIYVVRSHEKILPHLNQFKVDRIYQIDYHNDIVKEPVSPSELDEGTWANFYEYKNDCVFEWRYPDVQGCFLDGWGRCDWVYSKDDPWEPQLMGYKKIIRKQGLSNVDLSDVAGVSMAISRQWWDHEKIDFVFDRYSFLRKFKPRKKSKRWRSSEEISDQRNGVV